MAVYGGIDFGTTNSSAALSVLAQKPQMALLEDGHVTIPTAMFFADNGKISFGREAMQHYMLGEQGRCLRSIKRILGTPLMKTATQINGRAVRFEEILKCFLRHLKNKMEDTAQNEIPYVVLGRPVHFRDNDPKGDDLAQQELYKAAMEVGFKMVDFQFEPIAAAFAHEAKLSEENLACVVDVGGGTSDFTIIRLGPNLIAQHNRQKDILASSGVRIGGNDFDKELALKCFMPELGMYTTYGDKNLFVPTSQYFDLSEWSSVNNLYSYKNFRIVREVLLQAHQPDKYQNLLELMEKERGHNFLSVVEQAKIALTLQAEDVSTLEFLQSTPLVKITQSEFEKAINSEIDNIKITINECLRQAQVNAEKIELIILTGGSTEIPLLQKKIAQIFPQEVLSQDNKLASVGLGLAYDSVRRFA